MLALALYVCGGLLLLLAAVTLAVGGALLVFLPQLVIGGLVLIAALWIERWRYKPLREAHPDPRWLDTGERIVDAASGRVTAVWHDPANGERHYLTAPAARR